MILFYIIIFLFGICVGSFLNALEWRVYGKIFLLDARSKCPNCKNQLKWYDNVPLISFSVLRGNCRSCHQKISWQYPLIELWMGFIFVFLAYYNLAGNIVSTSIEDIWSFVLMSLVVWILTFIFVYDFKYQEVLDSMTLIPALIIFIINFYVFGASWTDMLLGALIGSGFFLVQYVVSKGKWVGGGDIRIGLLMGVILGWKLLLLALWLAYIVGAIISVVLLLKKKKQIRSQIAFGTFLSVSTAFVMIWGEGILEWYIRLVS